MKPKICRWLIILAALAFTFGAIKAIATRTIELNEGLVPSEQEMAHMRQINAIRGTLHKLIGCESRWNPFAVAVNDGNTGLDSKGYLQFQLPTFKGFALEYALFPKAEAKELENFWADPEAQIKVATRMLEDDMENLDHWYNCRNRLEM